MNLSIEFANKISIAYSNQCKPLCRQLKLPQTAFDILMFLANNPQYSTARDIVEIRKIKANLVSVNVEKLVCEGLLQRKELPDDRRKTQLICTEKAAPIIEKGRKLQLQFAEELFSGIDDGTREVFLNTMNQIEENIDTILKGVF